jgi:hypothetical protein
MSGINSEIKNFYFYYHTAAEISPEHPNEIVVKTSLCKRMDFVNAACDGLVFLVNNLGRAAISAIALAFTLGFHPSFKASLYSHAYEGLVHAGTIPVSIAGIISPSKINRGFLNLAPVEIRQPRTPDNLTMAASLLGTLVMRTRHTVQ